MKSFAAALRASLPVLLGYSTIGLAFGLVLTGAGLPWILSPLMAVSIYAGAAQFMGVGLLASGASLFDIGLLTLLMNARHAVYGLSMLERFRGSGLRKLYLIFGLTDETYGLLTTVQVPAQLAEQAGGVHSFYTWLTLLNQSYWVAGCTLGAIIGQLLPFDTTGLDFALTALFIVLLMEQIRSVRRFEPYLFAVIAAVFAFLAADSRDFLLIALLVAIGLLSLFRTRLEDKSVSSSKPDKIPGGNKL